MLAIKVGYRRSTCQAPFQARLNAINPHSPAYCSVSVRPNTTDPNMQGYQ
jgi:hypothetical protein